jgi:hypothetical protein
MSNSNDENAESIALYVEDQVSRYRMIRLLPNPFPKAVSETTNR